MIKEQYDDYVADLDMLPKIKTAYWYNKSNQGASQYEQVAYAVIVKHVGDNEEWVMIQMMNSIDKLITNKLAVIRLMPEIEQIDGGKWKGYARLAVIDIDKKE